MKIEVAISIPSCRRSKNTRSVSKGQAEVVAAEDWSRQLYREFRPQPAKPLEVTFIPYYAWDNRGLSEMTVWMPVK